MGPELPQPEQPVRLSSFSIQKLWDQASVLKLVTLLYSQWKSSEYVQELFRQLNLKYVSKIDQVTCTLKNDHFFLWPKPESRFASLYID